MSRIKTIFLFLVAFTHQGCQHVPDLSEFDNWVGTWKSDDGHGRVMYEEWNHKNPLFFEGTNFSVTDGDTIQNEKMRLLVRENFIAYDVKVVDSENGYRHIEFKLVEKKKNKAIFENLENKFPQRIIYKRTGREYMEIELSGQNEKDQIYTFVKQ